VFIPDWIRVGAAAALSLVAGTVCSGRTAMSEVIQPESSGGAIAPLAAERALAPQVLIGAGLEERAGLVTSFATSAGGDQVRFRPLGQPGARGGPQREVLIPVRDVIAIVPVLAGSVRELRAGVGAARRDGAGAAESSGGWIELADGQVFPGGPTMGAGFAADRVAWSARLWGAVLIDLEGVHRIVVNAKGAERLSREIAAAAERASEDRVVLINGDVLGGFVESVSGSVVRIDSGGEVRSLDLARVATIAVASPAARAAGARVWLSDGTVARAALRAGTGGRIGVGFDGPWIERAGPSESSPRGVDEVGVDEVGVDTIELDEIEALAFDASRLVALGSLTARVEKTTTRRWTPPLVVGTARGVALGAPDIELPGPMTAEWVLPAGASHVSMRLELPESARVFGDCVVRVEIAGDDASAVEHRLTKESPSAAVRLAVGPARSADEARRLVVRVEAGERGGIQDRVVLRRGLVLLGPAQD